MAGVEQSKARQIYLTLRDQIVSGQLADGTALPGEQVLAFEHGVSRVTVRRALAELEREDLVSRRQGAGTFVRNKGGVKPIVVDISDVFATLAAMGRETNVRLLDFAYCEASEQIASALKLKTNERVQRSVRVRLIDGKPFSFLVTYVPRHIGATYSEADLASHPLLSLLERSGVKVERATQDVSATLATPEAAAALEVDVGSPLIALTRTVFAEGGAGIEHLSALYRPDRYMLRMEMERKTSAGVHYWSTRLPTPANEKRRSGKAA